MNAMILVWMVVFAGLESASGLAGHAGQLWSGKQAVLFNGGGIFFWWQAGFCQFCLEQGFVKDALESDVKVIGTSAGALSAALLASGADFKKAADFAIYQTKRDKIIESKRLAFVWGGIVEEWLTELLPNESQLLFQNTFITATPADLFKGVRQDVLSNFQSKEDVVQACMASVHIPYFMDTRPCRKVGKDKWYIDGSFWPFVMGDDMFNACAAGPTANQLFPADQILNVDWRNDEVFAAQVREGFTTMISPERVFDMMDAGYAYAASLNKNPSDTSLIV